MSTTKPALTREEWEEIIGDEWWARRVIRNGPTSVNALLNDRDEPGTLKALAALCLYGQPFGFWPELPRTLRIAAEKLRVLTNSPDDWTDLEIAADHIEALLPPEE